MTEDQLRQRLKSAIKSCGSRAHPSWIESHATSAGFPDLEISRDGQIHHMELKVEKDNGSIVIRPSQFRWIKDQVVIGLTDPWLLVGMKNDMYVLVKGDQIYQKPTIVDSKTLFDENRAVWSFDSLVDAINHIFEKEEA